LPVFLLLILGVVALAASRGFPLAMRRSISLTRRVFLTLACAVPPTLFLFGAAVVVVEGFDLSKRSFFPLALVVTLSLIALSLIRGRGLFREGRAAKIEGAALALALAGVSLWPESAWLRYALGSAEGSRALALDHYERGEHERAAVFAAVACERGDAECCVLAAYIHKIGLGGPVASSHIRDLMEMACVEADDCMWLAKRTSIGGTSTSDLLVERACELGDRGACDAARRFTLSRRCDGRDAFACNALASILQERQGATSEVRELYRKACSLGDSAACANPALR
jgi:hypothetical protein